MLKICIIVGTRPEIIKMSPIIRYCGLKKNADTNKQNKEKIINQKALDYFILHTGQHYSYEMDKLFFEELGLPEPKYNLDVGSHGHGKQTGIILEKTEQVLIKEKPDIVLVQGDTNSVLAGALAAAKLHIKVGHVEAGLRSYDKRMPEEYNRVLADHCSDFLFAPSEDSRKLLLREGIDSKKIFVTGNTIVDAVYQNLEIAKKKSNALTKYHLKKNSYALVTAHRQENVDDKTNLKEIIDGLRLVSEELGIPVVYPIHPRTKSMLAKFRIILPSCIKELPPIGYLDFLVLEASAKLILTDSGGVQEEACILKVPCVTLRENTERPETIAVGANIIAGTSSDRILSAAKKILSSSSLKKDWKNPFGEGDAAQKIMRVIETNL